MTMNSWWFANFTTAWFIIAPLIAAYVPQRLLKSYFNHHVWQHAKAVLSLVDPYVTVDIARRDVEEDDSIASSNAYVEVKAYLSAACLREARALRAESAVEGDGFVLSLRLGQELADEFRGAVLWWSCVEAREDWRRPASGTPGRASSSAASATASRCTAATASLSSTSTSRTCAGKVVRPSSSVAAAGSTQTTSSATTFRVHMIFINLFSPCMHA
jgi:hypothetical protein